MNDKEFLKWIWDRLHYQHGENPNVDYMIALKSMADDSSTKFWGITREDLKWKFRNDESLAIEKTQKEQMSNIKRIIEIQES